ncbi:hypothetical protein F5148DRAFT_1256263 [Russula earlei]|uniref:Uncharacterized protein n=1 Tax=Russula earlei TaxID=71964 RepID=A0ACC0TSV4_9AGAM|nr:hypothetical protein F5148DRAFT_1256263 [Russula earlei]
MRITVSVDHMNVALQWTSTELLAGRWLWHNLSMLAPYDAELAGTEPISAWRQRWRSTKIWRGCRCRCLRG